MHRSLDAVQNQLVRFAFSREGIGHAVETLVGYYLPHNVVHFLLVDQASRNEAHVIEEPSAFLVRQTYNLYFVYSHRVFGYIHGLAALSLRHFAPSQKVPDCNQRRIRLYRGLISAFQYHFYAGIVETQHSVFRQVRLYFHVCGVFVRYEGIGAEHIDALAEYVGQIVDVRIFLLRIGELYSYNYVGAQFTGQSDRIIVPHTAVHQHHTFRPDRRIEYGDGHRGAQREREFSAVPSLGLETHHIRGSAEERGRQVQEVHLVTVAHGDAVDQVHNVLARHVALRQAGHEIVLDQRLLILGADGQVLAGRTGKLIGVFLTLPVIVLFVVERYAYLMLTLIGHFIEGYVLAWLLVGNEIGPVRLRNQFLHIIGAIAQRVHSAYEAAHTGSQHHIDRDAQFLYAPYRPYVGNTLGAASAQDQGHHGTGASDGIHPGPDRDNLGRVDPVVYSIAVNFRLCPRFRGRRLCPRFCGKQKRQQDAGQITQTQLFHLSTYFFSACLPASIPQAANMSSPLDARIVVVMPWRFSLSQKASITAGDGQS